MHVFLCVYLYVCMCACVFVSVCLCVREALGMPEPHLVPTEIGVRVGIEGVYKTWGFTTPLVSAAWEGPSKGTGQGAGQTRQGMGRGPG